MIGSGEGEEMDSEGHRFDESEIFNDVLEGGGIEPSINETIRESIKYSFVSSEAGYTGDIGNSESR